MHFALPVSVLTTLLLSTTSLAQQTNPASFTTWPCINCSRTGGNTCRGVDHQVPISNQCFLLEPGQQSIVVNTATPGVNCNVYLYGTTNCMGNGPVFGLDAGPGICKPIPVNEAVSYQVLCP
ncbi:hypothetical protein T440DRAFT_470475 [Plenodomus tracheiphilus IPT5]|uniref:Uncharacterized protein n=1 Tax=Plenodomus tracheiphilus IPT5 TaxID=1408161 RepID=A0A6A7AZ86_9PLEO|nr:hypothetical protein T440DRAFT_470475 [Plenodomus tracheiphilus IPT5]